MLDHALTIRAAAPRDADALRRLAALDSRPRRPALLAERGGVPNAAIALTSGSVVADPFNPSADAVGELRRCGYRLLRQGGDVAPLRSPLRRLASPPAGAG